MLGVLCQKIPETWKLCIRNVFEMCSTIMFNCQRSFGIKGAIVLEGKANTVHSFCMVFEIFCRLKRLENSKREY